MRSTVVNLLLALVAVLASATAENQQEAADKLVDGLLGSLYSRAQLQAPATPAAIQQVDRYLDDVALAKVPATATGGRAGMMALPSRAIAPAALPVAQPAFSARSCVCSAAQGRTYEVKQPKPIGVEFKQAGSDIVVSKIGRDADPDIKVGDKLIAVSASFGGEIWPAKSYTQTMFALSTRVGLVYMKLESKGKVDPRAANRPIAQHVCLDCGWTYNQLQGDPTFNQLPADFVCPQCASSKRRFARKNMETGEVEEQAADFQTIGTYATVVVGLAVVGFLTYIATNEL